MTLKLSEMKSLLGTLCKMYCNHLNCNGRRKALNDLRILISWAERARPYLQAMLDGHKEGDPTAQLDPEHVAELEQLLEEVQP